MNVIQKQIRKYAAFKAECARFDEMEWYYGFTPGEMQRLVLKHEEEEAEQLMDMLKDRAEEKASNFTFYDYS